MLSYYESRRLRQRRAGLGSLALTNKVDFLLSKLDALGERPLRRAMDEMSHVHNECPTCIACVLSRHAQRSKNYYYELLVKRQKSDALTALAISAARRC